MTSSGLHDRFCADRAQAKSNSAHCPAPGCTFQGARNFYLTAGDFALSAWCDKPPWAPTVQPCAPRQIWLDRTQAKSTFLEANALVTVGTRNLFVADLVPLPAGNKQILHSLWIILSCAYVTKIAVPCLMSQMRLGLRGLPVP